jgi:hypothetical protein
VGLRQNQVYLAALDGTGGRRLHHSTTFSTAARRLGEFSHPALLSPDINDSHRKRNAHKPQHVNEDMAGERSEDFVANVIMPWLASNR